MSNEQTANPKPSAVGDPYEADRLAAVDRLVSAITGGSVVRVQTGERASFNSHTQEVTVEAGRAAEERTPDIGLHIPTERAKLQERIDAAEKPLKAGQYGTDGVFMPDLKPGTEARAVAERRLRQVIESALFEEQRLDALEAQRARDAAARELAAREQLLAAAYTQGDAKRAALLKEEQEKENARAVAQAILKLRVG